MIPRLQLLILAIWAVEVHCDLIFKLEDKNLATRPFLFVEESRTADSIYAFSTENLIKCSLHSMPYLCRKVLELPSVDKILRCSDKLFLLTSMRKAWHFNLDNLKLTEVNLPFFIFPSALTCRKKNDELQIFGGFHNGLLGLLKVDLLSGTTTTTYASLFTNSIVDLNFDKFSNLIALSQDGEIAIIKDFSASRLLSLGEAQSVAPKLKKLTFKSDIQYPFKILISKNYVCAISSTKVRCFATEGLRPLEAILTHENITNGFMLEDLLVLATASKITVYKNWQKIREYEGELVSSHYTSNGFFIKHNSDLTYVTPKP